MVEKLAMNELPGNYKYNQWVDSSERVTRECSLMLSTYDALEDYPVSCR